MKDKKWLLCAFLAVLACQAECREIGAGQQQNAQDVSSSVVEATTQGSSIAAQPIEVQQPAARQQKSSDSVPARRLGGQVGPESAAEGSSAETVDLPVVTTSKFKKLGMLEASLAAATSWPSQALHGPALELSAQASTQLQLGQ